MTTKRIFTVTALAAATVAAAACDWNPRLDTRTFTLDYLTPGEVQGLLEPYVYFDREGAEGTMSLTPGAVTVRETRDNLDRIERVLAEFDVQRPDVRLRFQVIQADGYSGRDPAIAAVEEELRKIFQFDGYRLAGETLVTATDGSEVGQTFAGTDGEEFQITAEVHWMQGQLIRLEEVRMWARPSGASLTTTVNINPGQTLVLGSSSTAQSATTLLLTVTAETQ